ncbi:hypothetical protein Celaphus_00012657 [Cervus elaphus hippelaphus]|uniref:Uncharacterized protein n=1 Tax=Cervus elaphus hippelaphus TaxID=46360 RepID=A0A212CIZ2_CEREH|nr:hypothetical protein Celaphus_00012657 [Cervus elaphus hippelaphus]
MAAPATGIPGLRLSGLVAGSRQLCSSSSWRGGVCCRYGPWGELLQGWRVQSPWQLEQMPPKEASQAPCSSLPLLVPCWMLPGEGRATSQGFWNGNPDDDFRMPNGSTIPKRSSEEMLFHYGMTCESGSQGL